MEQFLLLMILVGGTQAFIPVGETDCDLVQITSPCSATAGGAVNIKLVTSANGYMVFCKKLLLNGTITVFTLKKGKVNIDEAFRSRTEFFIDLGTLKITNVERSDSGQYDVEIFDVNGIKVKMFSFNLEVKENIHHIWIPVCIAVGALLILVTCCCVCWKVRSRRKSGA